MLIFALEMIKDMTFHDRRATYFTLGCKLNFAETATIARQMEERGVRLAQRGEVADFCIVNTCSVTEVADHKCRQAIHKLVRENPGAIVVVTGCYAQLKASEVAAIEGVSLVLDQSHKGKVVEALERYIAARGNAATDAACEAANSAIAAAEAADVATDTAVVATYAAAAATDAAAVVTPHVGARGPFVPSCSRGERTRFFLKVQDGCDYFCTYCTIPFARGRSRNGSIASLVAAARQAASEGGREIVLTGVNIGDFGRTTGERFIDLLRALDGVEGIERYRISSIEPNLLTDEVLAFCAASRAFMPHFHIPLQSGSDEVLRLMHRRYTTELFYNKVSRARELMPDAFIGVDVIVGTRGETASLFDESADFIERLPISQLHVFSYSERPGTAALRIPHAVRPEEKHERSQRLLAISERKLQAFYERYVGTTRPVLLEHSRRAGTYNGFTDNYIKVEFSPLPPTGGKAAPNHPLDNHLIPLHLEGWNAAHDALIATSATGQHT